MDEQVKRRTSTWDGNVGIRAEVQVIGNPGVRTSLSYRNLQLKGQSRECLGKEGHRPETTINGIEQPSESPVFYEISADHKRADPLARIETYLDS